MENSNGNNNSSDDNKIIDNGNNTNKDNTIMVLIRVITILSGKYAKAKVLIMIVNLHTAISINYNILLTSMIV